MKMLSDTEYITLKAAVPCGPVETRVMIHANSVRTALEQSIVYTLSSPTHISLAWCSFTTA